MTAIRFFGVRTCARYVIRTCGESCSGIQVRAWIASDCVKRKGSFFPAVCGGSSHWSPEAKGRVAYEMRTRVAPSGTVIERAEPRILSGGAREKGASAQFEPSRDDSA